MKTIRISESQYNRLFRSPEEFMNEILSPLREVLKCRITEDRKHLVYEGKVYDAKTGDELPLTEQALGMTKALGTTGKVAASDDGWSISDILHTGVDIISTAADFIVPGSGAIIDIVHALSYIVEAQFSSGEEKEALYLMGLITGMFAIIPGALQAVAPILKRFVKTGGKMILKEIPLLKKAWGFVSKNISKFLGKLPQWVDKAVNSSIGKKILGKYSDKISSAVKNFSTSIRSIIDKLKGGTEKVIKKGKEAINKVIDPIVAKRNLKNWENLLEKGKVISKKGVPFDMSSPQGKAIIAGNPEKYLDKIVFDAKTGKVFSKNSAEGIETIAKNNEFLSTSGFKQLNKNIPEKFMDDAYKSAHAAKQAKEALKGAGKETLKGAGKETLKGAGKKLSKDFLVSNLKTLKNNKSTILKKYLLGSKNLTGGERKMLKTLHNHTPLGAPKAFIRNVKNIFTKGKRLKGVFGAITNIMMIEVYMSWLTRFLCNQGLKNRDDVEKLINLYEDFGVKGIYKGDDDEQLETWGKILSVVYNMLLVLGDTFWSLLDQPCRSSNTYTDIIKNILNQFPEGEFKMKSKEFIDNFADINSEGLDEIDLDSDLQDAKSGKIPSLDSNEEPEVRVLSARKK
jgi:hypothetical protein